MVEQDDWYVNTMTKKGSGVALNRLQICDEYTNMQGFEKLSKCFIFRLENSVQRSTVAKTVQLKLE